MLVSVMCLSCLGTRIQGLHFLRWPRPYPLVQLVPEPTYTSGALQMLQLQLVCKDIAALQGVKLELFIFDTFPLAQRVSLMEVAREAEFAPVKNAPGSASDSPDTARQAILSLHQRSASVMSCDFPMHSRAYLSLVSVKHPTMQTLLTLRLHSDGVLHVIEG